MRVASLADVKHHFSDYIEEARKQPVFVTRHGKITAVLEAISDEEVEDFLIERNARFRKMLEASARKRGGTSLASYRKKRKL